MNKFCMAAISALGATFAFPLVASAAPMGVSGIALEQARAEQSNIVQVQRQQRMRGGRNMQRGLRPGVRGPAVRGGRAFNRGGYWRGHRGYRSARPGYRYRNGFWFPPAAFAAGAILGGALAGSSGPAYAAPRGLGPEHYEWCDDRYKSYRASDNTFQPYEGPRQECNSPYS